MKGYQALTLGWDKPVRPETMLRKRTPARPHLLPFEVRKALYDLSVIERNAKAEIARVFSQHGFSKRQRANHIAKIRVEFGE